MKTNYAKAIRSGLTTGRMFPYGNVYACREFRLGKESDLWMKAYDKEVQKYWTRLRSK